MSEPRPNGGDELAGAARRAARRDDAGRKDTEPSLGARFGQIGILGWTMVVPTLAGLFVGRWLDHTFHTGVLFSVPLLILGAAFSFWSAWRWMQKQ